MKNRSKTSVLAVLAAALLMLTSSVLRADDDKKLDAGKAIVADPSLVPRGDKKIKFPENATLEEKIDILVQEIEALRAAAARATLIITVELELGEKENRSGAKISISGGKLAAAISCVSNKAGICVFVLEPLAGGDPDYTLTISKNRYVNTVLDFRIDPGAVVMVPVHVELTEMERRMRINPEPPTN